MSDAQAPQAAPATDARMLAIVCYGLFLFAFTNGLTAIVGVVLAHIKRGETRGTIWESHFTNLIHVFWIGVAFWVVFFCAGLVWLAGSWHAVIVDDFPTPIFAMPILGLAFLAYVVWYLYRVVRGLLRALENRGYA
ncbi:MAG: DUF4870 family protein [Rhizomicrobium sp.]